MELQVDDHTYVIKLKENLGIKNCIDFRRIYEQIPEDASLTLDFGQVDEVDSSCVVMLMSMCNHFNEQADIHIVNCNSKVSKLFSVTYISQWMH